VGQRRASIPFNDLVNVNFNVRGLAMVTINFASMLIVDA